jgi:hypothetical protein
MPALYSYLRLSLAGIMHALLLFEIEYFYLKSSTVGHILLLFHFGHSMARFCEC